MKHLALNIILILFVAVLPAQTGLNLHWEQAYSNDKGISARQLVTIHSHNAGIVVTGNTSTTDGLQMYMANYQPNGQLAWEKTLSSDNPSSIWYVDNDQQGDFYVIGNERVNSSISHCHLAKISSNGTEMWRKVYDGVEKNGARVGYMKMAQNHLYLCGTEEGPQGYDIGWVAKFDLSGNLVWEKSVDPGVYAALWALTIDNAGTVTAVGSGDDGYAFLAVQYSSGGTLNWQYPDTVQGSSEQYLSDVIHDGNGNVYMVGTRESGSFFQYDIVTLKLDASGNKLWEEVYTNGGENYGSFIRLAPNGQVIAFGTEEDNFDESAIAIAYDNSGAKQWESRYTIDNNTSVADVDIATNGEMFVAVQDFDSLGVIKLSSGGNLLASKTYGQDEVDYIADIVLGNGGLWGLAYKQNSGQSALFTLQTTSLAEDRFLITRGNPMSDVRAEALTTDGNFLWLATVSDDGDTNTFTVTKTDLSGNTVWEKSQRYDGSFPYFPQLTHDGSGNVIGLFQNDIVVTSGHTGLVKYDASGNELFTVLLDSSIFYYDGAMALDNAGNVFLCGFKEDVKQMFLSKYNASGVLQWTKKYIPPSSSFPYANAFKMVYTAQGKLVIAAVHKKANSQNDLHLFQYANDGSLEWNKDVDNQSGNLVSFAEMKVASNGDITLLGSSGTGTYIAARYDMGGNMKWEEKGFTSTTGVPRDLDLDAQGNVYLSFSANGHAYFRKLDASGNLIKDKQLDVAGIAGFYYPYFIEIVNNDLVVLGEKLNGAIGSPLQMLLDDQLNLIYGQIDSMVYAKVRAMAVGPTGLVYGAYSEGDQGTQLASRTALLRQYAVGTVGIEDQLPEDFLVTCYPNPASGQVYLRLAPSALSYRISLHDISGKQLAKLGHIHHPEPGTDVALALPSGLAPGLYLLALETGREKRFYRLMIR
ncbi:MAG: hypothetical protein R3B47_04850 [Bacteroidia bacterium]